MKKKRKVTITQTEPFVDVDGVRYISSKTAMDMFNLSVSAWTKKRRICDVEGRRFSPSNTLYYTMEEAEKIVNVANYRSGVQKTFADHVFLVSDGLKRLMERMTRMAELDMIADGSLVAQLRDKLADAYTLAQKVYADACVNEGKQERPLRKGRTRKNTNTNKEE